MNGSKPFRQLRLPFPGTNGRCSSSSISAVDQSEEVNGSKPFHKLRFPFPRTTAVAVVVV